MGDDEEVKECAGCGVELEEDGFCCCECAELFCESDACWDVDGNDGGGCCKGCADDRRARDENQGSPED